MPARSLTATLLIAAFAVGACGGKGDEGKSTSGNDSSIEDVAQLRECFEHAGAEIATDRSDVAFAKKDADNVKLENEAATYARLGIVTMELKPSGPREADRDYRIFTTYKDNPTATLYAAIESPESQELVAYFPPPANRAAVKKAEDECLGGT